MPRQWRYYDLCMLNRLPEAGGTSSMPRQWRYYDLCMLNRLPEAGIWRLVSRAGGYWQIIPCSDVPEGLRSLAKFATIEVHESEMTRPPTQQETLL